MSDFQALIESNRRLAEVVENKVSEIDKKVNQTANEIAQVITSNNVVVYYVDGVAGSDSNSGSRNSPFKTLIRALNLCPTGSKARIYLQRSQRYTIDRVLNIYAAFVEITPISYNTDISRPYHYDETTPIVAVEAQINVYGSITFGSYRSSLIVETNERTPWEGFQFWASSTVTIARSRLIVNLPDVNKPIFGSEYNYLSPVKVALREADIVKQKGFVARSGCIFSVDGATGFDYTEDVIRNATKYNTISNAPFRPEVA
ncbi:TPA: hypothetical protein SLZ51_002384 [Vibrio cholerae]|nr:hypothetical protein [Vibrio cholerae]